VSDVLGSVVNVSDVGIMKCGQKLPRCNRVILVGTGVLYAMNNEQLPMEDRRQWKGTHGKNGAPLVL
jgi:hypothetical protein